MIPLKHAVIYIRIAWAWIKKNLRNVTPLNVQAHKDQNEHFYSGNGTGAHQIFAYLYTFQHQKEHFVEKRREQKAAPFFLSCALRRFPDDCISPPSERYPSPAPPPSAPAPPPSTAAPRAARLPMLLHLRITSSLTATDGLGLGSRSGGSASGAGAMVTPKRRIPAGRESWGIPPGRAPASGAVAFLLGGVGGGEQRQRWLFIYLSHTVFLLSVLSMSSSSSVILAK